MDSFYTQLRVSIRMCGHEYNFGFIDWFALPHKPLRSLENRASFQGREWDTRDWILARNRTNAIQTRQSKMRFVEVSKRWLGMKPRVSVIAGNGAPYLKD